MLTSTTMTILKNLILTFHPLWTDKNKRGCFYSETEKDNVEAVLGLLTKVTCRCKTGIVICKYRLHVSNIHYSS